MAVTKLSAEERVIRSRIFLLMYYPFFGTLALHLRLEEREDIPTAATDGKKLYYNPEFIDGLSDPEVNFIIVHEVLHPALGHLWRKGSRIHEKWNYATDFAINLMIMETNNAHFRKPNGVLYDEKYTGMFAEEIYEQLEEPDELSKKYGSHGSGAMGSHDPWDDAQGGSSSADDQEWQSRVANAAQVAQGRGNLPASLRRLIKQYTNPQKNWREVLAEFVSHEIHDYSFSPTDRRFVWNDLLLPDFAEEVEVIKDLVIAIDTSGSVDDNKLAQFIGEIKGLIDQFGGITGHLMYFDAQVAACYPLEDPDTWEPKGGGGTNFRPIFQYIKDNDFNCSGCIVVTDLDGWFPEGADIPTDYPTLWVCDNERHDTVPFGQLTYLN